MPLTSVSAVLWHSKYRPADNNNNNNNNCLANYMNLWQGDICDDFFAQHHGKVQMCWGMEQVKRGMQWDHGQMQFSVIESSILPRMSSAHKNVFFVMHFFVISTTLTAISSTHRLISSPE